MKDFEQECCVYWIRRKSHTDVSSQGYVGISSNFEYRLSQHVYNCQNPKHYKSYRTDFMNAVSSGDYVASILVVGTRQYCLEMEEKLRPDWTIGWNIAKGGSGGFGKHGLTGHKVKSIYYNLRRKAEERGEDFHAGWLGEDGLVIFAKFYENLPEEGELSVIVDGNGYNPDNIEKVSRSELNRRSNAIHDIGDGRLHSVVELGEMFNIKPNTISTRLCRGYSIKEAVGLQRKIDVPEFSYEKELAIHYLWNSPMTPNQIGKLVGLGKSCLKRQLSRYKLPNWLFSHYELTSVSGTSARRLPRSRSLTDFETIILVEDLFEMGIERSEIATRLGLNTGIVDKLLEDLRNATYH